MSGEKPDGADPSFIALLFWSKALRIARRHNGGLEKEMPRQSGALKSRQAASACWLMALLAISVSASSVGLLFLESLLQKRHGVFKAKLFRPSNERTVAGDFIVLYRLRGGEEAGIKRRRALDTPS